MTWLWWYAPWPFLDGLLRLELVLWLATVAAAGGIWIRTIVLGRPWLALEGMRRAARSHSARRPPPPPGQP